MQTYVRPDGFPLECKTKSGLDVIIFYKEASEDLPILGMYYTEKQWFPHRWTRLGKFDNSTESGLDLTTLPWEMT